MIRRESFPLEQYHFYKGRFLLCEIPNGMFLLYPSGQAAPLYGVLSRVENTTQGTYDEDQT